MAKKQHCYSEANPDSVALPCFFFGTRNSAACLSVSPRPRFGPLSLGGHALVFLSAHPRNPLFLFFSYATTSIRTSERSLMRALSKGGTR